MTEGLSCAHLLVLFPAGYIVHEQPQFPVHIVNVIAVFPLKVSLTPNKLNN